MDNEIHAALISNRENNNYYNNITLRMILIAVPKGTAYKDKL